jgi:hypothetical protein
MSHPTHESTCSPRTGCNFHTMTFEAACTSQKNSLVVLGGIAAGKSAYRFDASQSTQPCVVSSATASEGFNCGCGHSRLRKNDSWSMPRRHCCQEERAGLTPHGQHSHALPCTCTATTTTNEPSATEPNFFFGCNPMHYAVKVTCKQRCTTKIDGDGG